MEEKFINGIQGDKTETDRKFGGSNLTNAVIKD
jgi:hypothetical protein